MLSGCSSSVTKTQYYTLQVNALSDQSTFVSETGNVKAAKAADSRIGGTKSKRIGIYPINMPTYTKYDGVVSLSESYQLNISRNHVWAGELDREATRVVTANIRKLSYLYGLRWMILLAH